MSTVRRRVSIDERAYRVDEEDKPNDDPRAEEGKGIDGEDESKEVWWCIGL